MFEISTLEFVKIQSFVQIKESLNFGPKIPYLGIFRLTIEKAIVIFEISSLEFVKTQSFVLR